MNDVRTIDDRMQARKVREWARVNGHQVPDRGRIPAAIQAMYQSAAIDAGDPGDDEPDWSQIGDGGEGDALAAMEDELGAPPPFRGPSSPPPPPSSGPDYADGEPPPVTNLDEARERLGAREPKRPAWAAPAGGRKKTEGEPERKPVTKAVRDDITGKLALLLSIPASTWQAIDPYCGSALADNLDNIVVKAVPLLCLSPEVVRLFSKATVFMLLLEFTVAVQPVAIAVGKHHVQHSVNEMGQVIRRKSDEVIPGEPAVDWSAYTTDIRGHVPAPRPA